MEYVWTQETDFIQGRYLSQRSCPHFLFASKRFMDIKYPYMYFWGDEDHILSIKLFCNGFDMYELQNTYVTTVPKNMRACQDRSDWFLSAILKYDSSQNYTQVLDDINFDEKSNIKYDSENTVLSSHLFYDNTSKVINKVAEAAMLLENGFSIVLKEDFRNTERSIEEYFAFHNIEWERVLTAIDKGKQTAV
jgi:hypothetical protein